MKSTALVMCTAAVLAGCSMNSSAPRTAWGKKDVSMLDYRMDAGQCALIAVTMATQGNVANTAGGISGQNSTVPQQTPAGSGVARGAGSNGTSQASTNPSAGGPTYRDNASADFASRAANQQRDQEMAAQRARKVEGPVRVGGIRREVRVVVGVAVVGLALKDRRHVDADRRAERVVADEAGVHALAGRVAREARGVGAVRKGHRR